MGQSALIREVLGIPEEKAGPVPEINFELEKKIAKLINELNLKNNIVGGHDISDGGLILATAEICILNNIGIKIDSNDISWLFGEDQGLYLLVCQEKNKSNIEQKAKQLRIPLQKLGIFQGNIFEVSNDQIPLNKLSMLYKKGLDQFFWSFDQLFSDFADIINFKKKF